MGNIPSIQSFLERRSTLERQMEEEGFYGDGRTAAAVVREHRQIGALVDAYGAYVALQKIMAEAEEILGDPSMDADLKEIARGELEEAKQRIDEAEFRMLGLMIPDDSSDSRNTILEIRAGAGGDEASIFAGDLYRMYLRFSELKKWSVETISAHGSECGGFKEIIFLITGEDVYRELKFECGVHRVQRIPTTEANGRIHTSTVTVAVLPEAEEVDVQISPEELEVSVCRASGPGGQGVNTTDSAVQILHRPTGMIIYCADERSQQKNRVKAMKVLRSRLLEQRQREEREKYASNRKNQVGSGDRSERIRTYNFPQNRLTDHRIGLTLYSLTEIMEGELGEVIGALQKADQRQRIQSFQCRQ
ncbi:MAG: peptide chain release factor 1 [Puniceicoccales bacterium]|jgi:peptide chain release factor 1|nr:peptide chain release factor 1 [Puniceicoccales bacterium]